MMIGAAAFAFGATDTAMCMAASNKETGRFLRLAGKGDNSV